MPEPGCNRAAPVLQVEHFRLEPMGNGWKRECPACGQGLLLVVRHPDTFRLEPLDSCTLCAQRVEYLDIEDMRRKDGSAP